MTEKTGMSGAQAAANAMRQINPDVAPVYPITPQTPVMETFAKFVADGKADTEMVRVESEHSAISAAVGASAAGARAWTATSANGLALMMEILPIVSGLRLPVVMNVVNRALSAPINIHCDHSDSMACRDFGWIQIYSENNQEVYDNTLLAQKIAEKAELPVMVMQDGFITSHSFEEIELLEDGKVKEFLKEYSPETSLLKNRVTYGALQLTDYNFETKRQLAEAMKKAKDIFSETAAELSELTKREYSFFEKYCVDDADYVFVVMSSSAGTAKEEVDKLRKKGKKAGVLKIVLFRPFPYEEIRKTLEGKTIAVLDRSESFGALPPLCSEIRNSLGGSNKIQSFVYGIGGRELFGSDIEKAFNAVEEGRIDNEIKYLGVRE